MLSEVFRVLPAVAMFTSMYARIYVSSQNMSYCALVLWWGVYPRGDRCRYSQELIAIP